MKFNRIFTALLALLLCLGCLPLQARAETIASGTCGESLIWELSDQGVLTISGTGPMDNFSDYSNPVPWKEHMDAITALVIKPGITYIGANSFKYHKNLKTVDLPTGMSEIGAAAFSHCESLETIVIPDGVTKVGNDLFHSCTKLKMVVLPQGLRWISSFMFYYCIELSVVVIPKSVYEINRDAFSKCNQLWHVLYTGSKSQWKRITIQGSVDNSEYCLESATRHYKCDGDEITDLANKDCSICNGPCEHKWNDGKVIEDPSCAAEGKRKYTCTLCGETKTESIPKLDTHDFDYWKPFDEACHKRICHLCGIEETEPHVLDDGLVTKDATCTVEGVKTYTCTQCRGTVTESISATGHSYGQWLQTIAPTYEEPGLEERECGNCGAKEQRSISKLEPAPTEPSEPTPTKPSEPAATEPQASTPSTAPSTPSGSNSQTETPKAPILPIFLGVAVVILGSVALLILRKKRK